MQLTGFHYDKSSTWNEEQPNKHPDWTLIFVIYGRCVYWINEKKQVLEKGQWLLIPSETPFYDRSVPTKIHEKFVLQFDAQAAQDIFPLLQQPSHTTRLTGKFDIIADRLRLIYRGWQDKQPYYMALCDAHLQELFVYLQREWDQAATTSATALLVEQMKGYIQNHYREHVTKDELGTCISRSPNYAASLFRQVTGQTISEFVHVTRIKTAVYMLRHSALTVTEIAEFIGYNDPSYFYRVFRRMTGLVPTELVSDRETIRK
ncbi:HTH-type transcriptional activator Btr [Paenibacillus allorhizoplanae]|uniref:HTH-type transcriptional activator Btr n=1 Tax=Paenibacillus allorhizoplanae TaxID=2905648 RepID=A0ABM9C759_9BACL|nr:AraC family transcriptional regulator [Paenibacillus allorhizoplanae]CAH1206077.1 HTH-type transcriptional activator Btr [Paenibacillus allorhizoplanae]